MLKHHEDSVKNMVAHYSADSEIIALFLVGSLVTGTARPDSDVDGVAVIPEGYLEKTGKRGMEVVGGKCTYEGGYFDVHFKTRKQLEELAENGSEPMRNLFTAAKVLYCHDPDLPALVARIAVLREESLAEKQKGHYCTLKQFHRYFWICCKPQGFYRQYVANGMIFSLYRLILLENKVLFPSSRKLEDVVQILENKPPGIMDLCHDFMRDLTDNAAQSLVEAYEQWTTYDYPTDSGTIINGFKDPYEWF